MTKREAKARKQAYTKALSEGRVVRYNGGMTFRSFATVEEAEKFVLVCSHSFDPEAEIVCV